MIQLHVIKAGLFEYRINVMSNQCRFYLAFFVLSRFCCGVFPGTPLDIEDIYFFEVNTNIFHRVS